MTENRKTPKLRFKGFTDAWEQRKFSDVVEIGSGMDYKHLGIGDIPVYGTGGYMLSVDVALSENNDAIGIGRKGTIDKPYILRAPFWTVDTLFYCIPKYNHNLDFTNCLFQNVDWKNKDESTGVPSLSKVIINNIETSIPSYEEQKKIGEYFKSFDNLITLHQRKLDRLKNIKKSMLDKMFPKDGEVVPEIRFKGFTDAWEQRKFSDVVEIGSGMDYKHLGIGDIPVYGTGGYMLSVDVALSENNDAIGIGRKGTIDKPYILRAPFWTVDTLFYCIPKYNHNLDFTNCLFQNVDWKNKDESTGVPSLSKVIINNIETSIPSYEEQKKIGEYFKSFDNLITLHQRKLDKLKNIKKSMLDNMFV